MQQRGNRTASPQFDAQTQGSCDAHACSHWVFACITGNMLPVAKKKDAEILSACSRLWLMPWQPVPQPLPVPRQCPPHRTLASSFGHRPTLAGVSQQPPIFCFFSFLWFFTGAAAWPAGERESRVGEGEKETVLFGYYGTVQQPAARKVRKWASGTWCKYDSSDPRVFGGGDSRL